MTRWQIGGVRITKIVEAEGPTPPSFLFADLTPQAVAAQEWLRPHFATADGKLLAAVQALVIESNGRLIVVDTCVGNDKVRPVRGWNQLQTGFLDDLAAAGFPPDSIDTVLCTHLHVDHVGWNTRLVDGRWVPTFRRARYLFARTEWEHWTAANDDSQGDVIGDSVRPVVDAGLSELVESKHRLTDEIALEPTPGHTPGHVSVRIRSQGEEGVISGDLMHHPIQCALPDLGSRFDVDAAVARQTRREFLDRCAGAPVTVFGTHFAGPTAGHVVAAGEAWRFRAREMRASNE